jgi:hypothetical protein
MAAPARKLPPACAYHIMRHRAHIAFSPNYPVHIDQPPSDSRLFKFCQVSKATYRSQRNFQQMSKQGFAKRHQYEAAKFAAS